MRKPEFPDTVEEAQSLIDELTYLAENEPDREKRRELFLLKIELRDHLAQLRVKKKKRITKA